MESHADASYKDEFPVNYDPSFDYTALKHADASYKDEFPVNYDPSFDYTALKQLIRKVKVRQLIGVCFTKFDA
jgi:hypothetical protein